MSSKYILVTGATGFIGSHVADRFLADGTYRIIALVRRKRDYKNVSELERKGAVLVEGDLQDRRAVNGIFDEYPVEGVIHLAALRGGGAGSAREFLEVNVLGTEVLLEASLNSRVKKFIFCSSVGVFGTIPARVPANVETELSGDNQYHKSKILAENCVRRFIMRGLNAYIVRPTITYGAGDQGFPATLVGLVRKRLLVLPFTDIKIHLLDVERLADWIQCIFESENLRQRILIVADDNPVSLRDLVNRIHIQCHDRVYPSWMRLPDILFKGVAVFLKAMGSEKWLTRVLLISRSWYYDLTREKEELPRVSRSTVDLFVQRMCG